ncbi:pilus assembly PilX N-terminal domain-containing protein [Candidatus Peregrinibacteria bacterium]|nr:pilus assembly PilX N-terminal domain-containing protein [Candidatus Peregrinibacteria bacterium]
MKRPSVLKNNWRILKKNSRGTALLTALLVMGVLIAVSLALSVLILREGSIVKATLDGGKAYYAAESGIEIGLYKLQNGLPQSDEGDFDLVDVESNSAVRGHYVLKNTCMAYPCFDEDEYDLEADVAAMIPLKEYYDVLDLNESIMLPLFVVKNGVEVPVGDFTVEFFGNFKWEDFTTGLKVGEAENIKFLSSWDVLRWKIFGLNGEGKTESISDFTAISDVGLKDGDVTYAATASIPSWFGSVNCEESSDRYTDKIKCGHYGLGNAKVGEGVNLKDQEAGVFAGVCFNTEAREVYLYGGDGEGGSEVQSVQECYPIKEFLKRDTVKLKYLSLTNLMNPSVFEQNSTLSNYVNEDDRLEKSKIFFRVELFTDSALSGFGNETVREYADITANGYSGNSQQSINVEMQRGSFMPVFHFSLYSTYKDAGGHDAYYGTATDAGL